MAISNLKSFGQDAGTTKEGAAGDAHTGKKVEGRAVIGDGAPFAAQHSGLGVQGWRQSAALNKRKKYLRQIKHNYEEEVARGDGSRREPGGTEFAALPAPVFDFLNGKTAGVICPAYFAGNTSVRG